MTDDASKTPSLPLQPLADAIGAVTNKAIDNIPIVMLAKQYPETTSKIVNGSVDIMPTAMVANATAHMAKAGLKELVGEQAINDIKEQFQGTTQTIIDDAENLAHGTAHMAKAGLKELVGEQAIKNIKESFKMPVTEGREVEATALQTKGLLEGAAHIVTAPIRGLDAVGIIHLKDVSTHEPPAMTPSNNDWKKNWDKIAGPKI